MYRNIFVSELRHWRFHVTSFVLENKGRPTFRVTPPYTPILSDILILLYFTYYFTPYTLLLPYSPLCPPILSDLQLLVNTSRYEILVHIFKFSRCSTNHECVFVQHYILKTFLCTSILWVLYILITVSAYILNIIEQSRKTNIAVNILITQNKVVLHADLNIYVCTFTFRPRMNTLLVTVTFKNIQGFQLSWMMNLFFDQIIFLYQLEQ